MADTAEANKKLIEAAYAAFGRGDIPAVLQAFHADILWHVPGRGPISGDYEGHEAVLGFFKQFMDLSGGTFRIQIDDVLANETRVVVLVTESAERKGRTWSSPQVHAWTVKDGKAAIFWQFQGEPADRGRVLVVIRDRRGRHRCSESPVRSADTGARWLG